MSLEERRGVTFFAYVASRFGFIYVLSAASSSIYMFVNKTWSVEPRPKTTPIYIKLGINTYNYTHRQSSKKTLRILECDKTVRRTVFGKTKGRDMI